MILFPENLVLENERVRLTPLQTSDLIFLLPFALNEPDLWSFSMVSPAGKEGMEQYIRETILQRETQKEYPFLVFDKVANSYAGCTRFYDIQLVNATTQLGYTWYGTAFQRSGLNRHCKLLLLGYAFEHWGMERVEFRAHGKNIRSIEAMKNIGCTVEGILRSAGPTVVPGVRRDSIILSILKEEWSGGVKEKLLQKIYPASLF